MIKKLKIAQIAPVEETIPPKKYGGVELVVYSLAEGLRKRGHQVYLFGAGETKSKAKYFPLFPKAIREYSKFRDVSIREAMKNVATGQVIDYLLNLNADIIHNHAGVRFLPFSVIFKKTPFITTIHGPLDLPTERNKAYLYNRFKNLPYVSISFAQRKPMPQLNYAANIYHGIDICKYQFSKKGGNYLSFLARIAPEKGPVEAILIAKTTGIKLKIAAKVDPLRQDFYEKEVKPLIDGKQIQFLGEVSHRRKVELLKNSLALLAPIKWREPFGLFLTEAMACGTPVIVFDQGSAREVVKDGKTGFVVKDIEEAVGAVKKIKEIKREDCRKWVEENFTVEKMVQDYEKLFYRLLK